MNVASTSLYMDRTVPFIPGHGATFWDSGGGASVESEGVFGVSGDGGTEAGVEGDDAADVAGQNECGAVEVTWIEDGDLAVVNGQKGGHGIGGIDDTFDPRWEAE